jgi:hypothetical protein
MIPEAFLIGALALPWNPIVYHKPVRGTENFKSFVKHYYQVVKTINPNPWALMVGAHAPATLLSVIAGNGYRTATLYHSEPPLHKNLIVAGNYEMFPFKSETFHLVMIPFLRGSYRIRTIGSDRWVLNDSQLAVELYRTIAPGGFLLTHVQSMKGFQDHLLAMGFKKMYFELIGWSVFERGA